MKTNEQPVVALIREGIGGIDRRCVTPIGRDPVAGRHDDRASCTEASFAEHRLGPGRELLRVRRGRLEIPFREDERLGDRVEIRLVPPQPSLPDEVGEQDSALSHCATR
ncbi:MAG TPA: hypothetical protein VNJ28_03215 [Candidatus Limnocylindrales bacterium]|nr:hypothetical protein [Candidatus Limnocylindrales bacterium]